MKTILYWITMFPFLFIFGTILIVGTFFLDYFVLKIRILSNMKIHHLYKNVLLFIK